MKSLFAMLGLALSLAFAQFTPAQAVYTGSVSDAQLLEKTAYLRCVEQHVERCRDTLCRGTTHIAMSLDCPDRCRLVAQKKCKEEQEHY